VISDRETAPPTARSRASGKSVVVVGAGGNIGSHLVPHLARMSAVSNMILIDPQIYEAKNVPAQDIYASDIGKPKASVQADRLRRISPQLRVTAISARVEALPLGLLRADVILAALDSRRARQAVNEIAYRLNSPWIDAGVDGTNLLARVNVYVPGRDNPCLECAWSDQDYKQLEQVYTCVGGVELPPATNAPSALGALAASLEAIECQKLLEGLTHRVAVSKEVLLDAAYHKHYVTSYAHNRRCRFDHEIWSIEKLARSAMAMTLNEALELGAPRAADNGGGSRYLRVERQNFARRLSCPRCGGKRTLLRLEAALDSGKLRCRRCSGTMVAAGFDRIERLDPPSLPPSARLRTLHGLGLRPGEVFAVGGDWGESRYEIAWDRS